MSRSTQIPYYQDLIKQHGNNREAVGWGSESSQTMRFEVMCRHLDFRGHSVMDVGCGRGDLLSYLTDTQRRPREYIGVDLTEEMLELARQNHAGSEFIKEDFGRLPSGLPVTDFVVSSGVFNLLMEDHDDWMKAFIGHQFAHAEIGAAFNVISHHAPEHKAGHYYAKPAQWLEYCQSLTPYVCMRHDYAEHDVTFFLFRNMNELSLETRRD